MNEPFFFTLTVILWESGIGYPSLGLTTLYFPTVIALLLMSSEMHFVLPVWSSNLIEFAMPHVNAMVRIAWRRIELDIVAICVVCSPIWIGIQRWQIRVSNWERKNGGNQNGNGKELRWTQNREEEEMQKKVTNDRDFGFAMLLAVPW